MLRPAHPRSAPRAAGLAAEQKRILAFRDARGPFDIVGDVHGCLDELLELMAGLGYGVERRGEEFAVTARAGRTLAFLGDLVDRGPASAEVLRLTMGMARAGQAIFVAGNRDMELLRALKGDDGELTRGMARTLEQLATAPESLRTEAVRFLEGLASHCVLDEGRLVIAHAGLPEALHSRATPEARELAIRGRTTGERDASGSPIRFNWAAEYCGAALVVYGHTPVIEPSWQNNTVNIDTGCVYGGHLTALRYPERETVMVPARAVYHQLKRAFPVNAELARR